MNRKTMASFVEEIRKRIDVVKSFERLDALEDRLCASAAGTLLLTKEEIQSAKVAKEIILAKLAKLVPDLKAIEHSGEIGKREMTREEIIERLTSLQSAAASGTRQRPAERSAGADDGAEVPQRH